MAAALPPQQFQSVDLGGTVPVARNVDTVKAMESVMPMPNASDFTFPKAPPTAMERLERWSNDMLMWSGPVIRPLAKLFLLSTFLDDAYRMVTQWDTQVYHINTEWKSEPWVGNSFVIFNLVCQVLPCTIILLNGAVTVPNGLIQFCIGLLVVVVLAQSVAYHVLWNMEFFFRNLAVIGALCLVGAEATDPAPTKGGLLDGNLDEEEDAETADILRLSGRILVSLMFVTLTRFDTVTRIIVEIIGVVLLACVVLGFKTRLSCVMLFILLNIENLTLNDFFMHSTDDNMHDFKKFNFFQALTVTGGLMMLVALGPGAVSFDGEVKKNL
jgi:hypothetical protein